MRCSAMQEKLDAAAYADFGMGAAERVRVNDIMSVRETAAQMVDQFRRPRPRLPAGAEWLRPSLHLLHHSLSAAGNSRSVPMGAVVDEARRLAENGFAEIVLTGVDLTSYGADLPGAPDAGRSWCAKIAQAGAGAEAPAAFLHRFHRGRCRI